MKQKKRYSVLLVEDERACQERLISFINGSDVLELKDLACDGKEALKKLKNNKYDLVFLDINLPYFSGLEVIRKLKNKPYFIAMNSEEINAYHGNELGGIDFLLKPINLSRFNSAVRKFVRYFAKLENEITVHQGRQTIFLIPSEILFLEFLNRKTMIYTDSNISYNTKTSLKEISKQLPKNIFFRISKTVVVNLSFKKKFEHHKDGCYFLTLDDTDDSEFNVSRKYAKKLKQFLENNI